MSQKIDEETSDFKKFLVVGVVSSVDFQRCRYVVKRLHKGFPEEYSKPEIRPKLDAEWNEFIIKLMIKLESSTLLNTPPPLPSHEEKTCTTITRFVVVGYIGSHDFQKCRRMVEQLYRRSRDEYEKPEIRGLLDLEWNTFLVKFQRKHGGGSWAIRNKVIVFQNGDFLGDFNALFKLVWKTKRLNVNADWHQIASQHVVDYLEEKIAGCRQLAYLTISVNKRTIGSLLFELYSDLVPLTCENFLKRCNEEEHGFSFLGAPIHRIVKNGWLQCGGCDLTPIKLASENYVVPHNRRGVLSMCNSGPHANNSTQFFVTFEPAPWMNYKFVAFGQLLQGDEILKKLENLTTHYQSPIDHITIAKCGDFKSAMETPIYQEVLNQSQLKLTWEDQKKEKDDILEYLHRTHEVIGPEHEPPPVPQEPILSKGSLFSELKLRLGIYSLDTDLKSYTPFSHLPDYVTQDDEGAENLEICGSAYPIMEYNQNIIDGLDDSSPPSSDITLD